LHYQAQFGNVAFQFARNPLMHESKLTAKGQTTLPKDVRRALGLQSGDTLRYVILDGEVRIQKVRSVMELKGLLARSGHPPVSLEEMENAIAAGAAASMKSGE